MFLSSSEKKPLKARAQLLQPLVRLGHEGADATFYRILDAALLRHELVKVKFGDRKGEKKQLAPEIARQSGSELIMRVGNVAVYYRPKAVSRVEGPESPRSS